MLPNEQPASKETHLIRRVTGAVLLSSAAFLVLLSVQQVWAATYAGPTQTAPGGNIPTIIWNRLSSTVMQGTAAIAIDGGGATMGSFVGLSVGTSATDLGSGAAGQNLYYGIADYAKMNAGDKLLLLQVNSAGTTYDRLSVDRDGSAALAGTLTASNVETAGRVHGTGCVGHTFVGLTKTGGAGSDGLFTPTYIVDNFAGGGYGVVNARCHVDYVGSHVCRSEELLESFSCSKAGDPILDGAVVTNGTPAFVNGGPPGYKALANDCDGWTAKIATAYGRIWFFNSTTGGKGSQSQCNVATGIRFACCK
jgi:hypothetical protein